MPRPMPLVEPVTIATRPRKPGTDSDATSLLEDEPVAAGAVAVAVAVALLLLRLVLDVV